MSFWSCYRYADVKELERIDFELKKKIIKKKTCIRSFEGFVDLDALSHMESLQERVPMPSNMLAESTMEYLPTKKRCAIKCGNEKSFIYLLILFIFLLSKLFLYFVFCFVTLCVTYEIIKKYVCLFQITILLSFFFFFCVALRCCCVLLYCAFSRYLCCFNFLLSLSLCVCV